MIFRIFTILWLVILTVAVMIGRTSVQQPVHPDLDANGAIVYFCSTVPPATGPQPEEWVTCDVSAHVPEGTAVVDLRGQMAVTHGLCAETTDLVLTFRRDGAMKQEVTCRCTCALVGDCRVSDASASVPLTPERTFQWKWDVAGPTYQHPNYSAYSAALFVSQP